MFFIVLSGGYCVLSVILTQRQIEMSFFGDVNISVNGNHDIFKFTFTLKALCFRTKNVIMLFIPVRFVELHPINLSQYFLENTWKYIVLNADSV